MSYGKLNLSNGTPLKADHLAHIENGFGGIYDTSLTDEYSIHISFDDVASCISNLSKNSYASLFDEPFFGWLKNLHDTYGAKFSLYIYNLTTPAVAPQK